MKVYIGQTRSRKLIARLSEMGFGESVQPKEYPPRRTPWFLDNGAFLAWRAQRCFDAETFLRAVETFLNDGISPDFLVVPDIVAGGSDSARFSRMWGKRLAGVAPLYVALQDGMSQLDLYTFANAEWVEGFFVGGTLGWKIKQGPSLVEWSHDQGRPCHIGRVGTPSRVRWALQCGADSIDSCLPLWSKQQLNAFIEELHHPHLFEGHSRLDELKEENV